MDTFYADYYAFLNSTVKTLSLEVTVSQSISAGMGAWPRWKIRSDLILGQH